jgi:hypothetical protein
VNSQACSLAITFNRMSKDLPKDARAMAVALVQRIADPSRGTLTNREIVTLTQAVMEDLEELDAIDPARVLERLRLLSVASAHASTSDDE